MSGWVCPRWVGVSGVSLVSVSRQGVKSVTMMLEHSFCLVMAAVPDAVQEAVMEVAHWWCWPESHGGG